MSTSDAGGRPVLALDTVHVYYGQSHILQGVSLAVGRGEIVALVGRNGAGKTTTLKSIVGLVPPRAGTIQFEGQRLNGLPVPQIIRRGIGYVPEERRIFPQLSVAENLRVAQLAQPRQARRPERLEEVYALFPVLRERHRQAGGTLSGGEQEMLAIARALVGAPRLLLIDEPTQGLMPKLVDQLYAALQTINQRGVTILLVEQMLAVALGVAHRVYVLDQGRIRFEGTPDQLQSDRELQRMLLGVA
jgi:branched-chain amino acid transport system ATP-binding protein